MCVFWCSRIYADGRLLKTVLPFDLCAVQCILSMAKTKTGDANEFIVAFVVSQANLHTNS